MFLLLCTNIKRKCHSMIIWYVVVLCEKMVFIGFCVSCSFRAVKNASHLVQGVLLGEMCGTEWSITCHEDVRLVCFDLQCEDMHCHVGTPHLQCETQSISFWYPFMLWSSTVRIGIYCCAFLLNAINISLATKVVSIAFAAVVLLDHSVRGGSWYVFILWILWSAVLCHRRGEHLAKCCWRSEGCKLSVNLWLIINILGKKCIDTLMEQGLSWMLVCVFPVRGITFL